MRFYLVAILSMGLVLLLTVGKVSTTDPTPSTSPEPEPEFEEEKGGTKVDAGSENQPTTSAGPETTKAPESGCSLTMMSSFTIIPSLLIAKMLA